MAVCQAEATGARWAGSRGGGTVRTPMLGTLSAPLATLLLGSLTGLPTPRTVVVAPDGPGDTPDASDGANGTEPGVADPNAGDANADEGSPRAVNDQPCFDPGVNAPRIALAIEGWHPCEAARYVDSERGIEFFPGLQLRAEHTTASPFVVDTQGSILHDTAISGGRLRWRPELRWGGIGWSSGGIQGRIVATVDFASGRWSGGSSPLAAELLRTSRPPQAPERFDGKFPPQPRTTRHVDPRELWIELTFPRVGLIRVGQQAFSWGQGLLSNDGNNMARFGDLKFGPDGDGNLNERLLFATKPFSPLGGVGNDVIVGIGGDLVYRDDNASLMAGDIAAQGFVLAMWRPEAKPGTWLGGYAVHRWQRMADDGDLYPSDDTLQITAVDVAGQGDRRVGSELTLLGAFEGVVIAGRTDIASTEPDDYDKVRQGALALRGYFGRPGRWLAGFDGGFLSGDANAEDDLVNGFQANRGYTAGLVLFPRVLGWQSANAQRLAASDELAAVDPQGIQRIPTRGAVTNAIHVHPKGQFQLRDWLEIWGGPLLAWSATDVVDPYASRLTGSNANARGGGQGARFYGTELDLGVRARANTEGVWFQGGVQSGLLFPGQAIAAANGDVESLIWAVTVRAELRY